MIYIDSAYRCHTVNDGTMTAVETEFFDGKCQTFIEGYCFIPSGQTWIRRWCYVHRRNGDTLEALCRAGSSTGPV